MLFIVTLSLVIVLAYCHVMFWCVRACKLLINLMFGGAVYCNFVLGNSAGILSCSVLVCVCVCALNKYTVFIKSTGQMY